MKNKKLSFTQMYFISNGTEATNAVFSENDQTVAVLCSLTLWEQMVLLSEMFVHDHFQRLCFHRSLNGFRAMETFNHWITTLVHLSRLEITDAPNFGIEAMGQFFKAVERSNVRYLNVSGMNLGVAGAGLLHKTVKKSKIHTLRCERNNMQTGVRKLLALDLKRIMVGDNDVHRLWWPGNIDGISKSIRRLGLDHCNIDEKGFAALGRYLSLSNLIELDLAGNPFRIAGMKSLCQGLIENPHLEKLSLNGCQMQNWCVKMIGAVLPQNQRLQQLYMQNNPLINEIGQMYLIQGMQTNYTLRYIEIDVLFEKKCATVFNMNSRIAIDLREPVTAHLARLACFNQDLDLANRFWDPRLSQFYPVHMQNRAALLIFLLRPILPFELVLHILSFWHGIQFL